MSWNAKEFNGKAQLIDRALAVEADAEIRDYLEGCLGEVNDWEVSQGFLDDLYEQVRSTDGNIYGLTENQYDAQFKDIAWPYQCPGFSDWVRESNFQSLIKDLKTQGKSAGARYMAARVLSGADPDMAQLAKDWHAHKAIKRALKAYKPEYDDISVANIRQFGLKFERETIEFLKLWDAVAVHDRPLGSCYQPQVGKVKALATTPNYNRLPVWVKQGLIQYAPWIETERVGNIWRLADCVKGWRWGAFPKKIAERVGRFSPRSRMIAGLAWNHASYYDPRTSHEQGWFSNNNKYVDWDNPITRPEVEKNFWLYFRELQNASTFSELLEFICQAGGDIRCQVELALGLPFKTLSDVWQKDFSEPDEIIEAILPWMDPKQACENLFGLAGKGTVKAFRNCQNADLYKWAGALAYGDADATQKILRMGQDAIAWEPDAVEFLNSLPMVSRLRMLQAKTFRYRGEEQEISPDHIRDTGYLWKNIQQKPELGRIRCWFSVHEQLAAAFVKELPDEALPVPSGWDRVDGLCAVDASWSIELPKRVATLKYYGKVLNNCVGGYGPAIKQGRSVIFVVRERGIITHCVEINSRGECNQFYAARNQYGDERLKREVLSELRKADLIN